MFALVTVFIFIYTYNDGVKKKEKTN